MRGLRRSIAVQDLPYRFALRVLADILVVGFIAASGVLFVAMAQGTVPGPTSQEFPWVTVIQATATVLVAVFTWLVKNQVTRVHDTFNSKMDALIKLTADASRAEGFLEGQKAATAKEVAARSVPPPIQQPP